MDRRNDPLLDAFLYETKQILEKAERILLECEKTKTLNSESINEIFRIMHTIKGSSAMMEFAGISETAHAVEDLFFHIRERHPAVDFERVADIILHAADFIGHSILKIENGEEPEAQYDEIKQTIDVYLQELKGNGAVPADQPSPRAEAREKPVKRVKSTARQEADYLVWVRFDEDCDMESVRAFATMKQLEDLAAVVETIPADLEDFDRSSELIRKNGFELYVNSNSTPEEIDQFIRSRTVYLKDCRVSALFREPGAGGAERQVSSASDSKEKGQVKLTARQNFISVNVTKLDKLMDIVGELVISEVMVTRNPEITKLKIRSFMNAANQMKKITTELQDIVMSIRMVPIGPTFYSMQRIVRDMCKKLNKDVELIISGEDTEVDKNIIESIADPLMHLLRNAIDHGIEDPDTRVRLDKPPGGRIYLSARSEGGDVWITLRDDGRGLNREAILNKAMENGLLARDPAELTDKEVWSFILMPGFSTKKKVTEFSGRGVGMDVVTKNVEKIGGRLNIDSEAGKGSTFAVKIPLTLAIINGMEISVGGSCYTIPLTMIKESFRPKGVRTVRDNEGREAIMLRGECVEIMRLHKEFRVPTEVTSLEDGILIIVQNESLTYGIFADRLLGEHQVVVKPVPKYMGKIDGVSGCSVLGDGSISLILDIAGLLDRKRKNDIRRGENE
jgi:two-component system chemotaxis sensor kinase CheA